ncbi:uncharacterized protein PV06_06442 [Exophiala oligosperma]|uniref:F-box domain-containing protein n=1 Tax=Exophiala oligosperma TaxID=215243 RepID=A0A0D2ASW1_9EURO|nr:uncharacterized protein PV06_06442 [Exophiala oligosperma]KIW42946.1 hypothetical protein PV06_06442 [Exophiala oligosperma]
MPIFERVRRKLSRSKSTGGGSSGIITKPIPDNNDHAEGQIRIDPSWPTTALSLTPSDENLVSKLAFSPDTEFIERPPRLRTPSVAATQFSERTVFNNVESGFLSLPTELLLFLQPYLTPSSEVALRHTCSRFFHLYTLPSFVLKGKDLFDFLCMTERDQDPADLDRLVCGRCQELHVKTTFPASEVTRPPTARDCRTVWLCAHRTLGYAKTIRNVKPGVDSPFRVETLDPCSRCRNFIRTRSVAERPEKGTSQTDLESPKTQSLLITKVALLQAPSPLPYGTRRERSSSSGVVGGGGGGGGSTGGTSSGVYKELFSAKDVSDALSALDFRLCPHMKLGDPYILSKFCRACINTQRLPVGVKGPPCINDWKKKSNDLDDLVSGINNSIHNYMYDNNNRNNHRKRSSRRGTGGGGGERRRMTTTTTTEGNRCKGSCYTRGCKTQFMFQTRESLSPDSSGRRQVWLIIAVYRWLGPLQTELRDPTWTDHAVDHRERRDMRARWAEWERQSRGPTGRQQCMPNWSICLLHPEDSNLR